MRQEKISTDNLLQKLFKTKHIIKFMKNFDKQSDYVSFAVLINQLCAERNITPSLVIKNSTIERTYGHQLFSGKRTPSRDTIIRLAFGFGMDYDETQALLKTARKSQLYVKVKRDAVIIFALKRSLSIMQTQATLEELSLPLLGKDERTYE